MTSVQLLEEDFRGRRMKKGHLFGLRVLSPRFKQIQYRFNRMFLPIHVSLQSHNCDDTNQSVLTFVKEWPVRHRNVYSIAVHGVKTADGARVVLSIKNKTEVLSLLLGSYWLFCQVCHHQLKQVFGLKYNRCFH